MEYLEILKSKGVNWLPSTRDKKPSITEFTKQLTEKGMSEKEIEVVLNRLKRIIKGDETTIYLSLVKRYDPSDPWQNTKLFVEQVLGLNVPHMRKEEIELPGPDRAVSDFVSEIADFYATEEKLFYRITTDEIVRIGPIDLDNKGIYVLGLIPINADSLITFLEEDFVFYLIKYKEKQTKSIGPSLAKVILASLDQFKVKLPAIKRLFPVPIPRLNDGKLSFPKRGYDSTHFSFMPFNTPEIDPNMPLDKAKEILDYIYAEFAFTSNQDKINAIAHLLTPFCRGLFANETSRPPLFIYMANRERSGKDYAAGIVSIVYEGEAIEDTAISKENSNDEEFRKKIFAVLSSGRSIFHSSNNKGFINSAELEGLVTREKHSDRKLGTNVEYNFPNILTISMSANTGLSYTPDIQYRSIFINLFLAIEDPNERTFKNPTLHQWVKEHRSEILSALFTLVRNWHEKGMPVCSKPFTSFPEWMRVVGGILEAAGIGIPQQNDALNSIGGNREEIAMKQFYETAYKKWPNEWVDKATIFRAIENKDLEGSMNPEEGFEEIFDFLIWNKNPTSAKIRFGMLLKKYAGRVLSGIEMKEDKRTNAARNQYYFALSGLSGLSEFTTPSNQKEERKEGVEKAYNPDNPYNKSDSVSGKEVEKADKVDKINENAIGQPLKTSKIEFVQPIEAFIWKDGEHGPFEPPQRVEINAEIADILIRAGRAIPCETADIKDIPREVS